MTWLGKILAGEHNIKISPAKGMAADPCVAWNFLELIHFMLIVGHWNGWAKLASRGLQGDMNLMDGNQNQGQTAAIPLYMITRGSTVQALCVTNQQKQNTVCHS